MASSPKSKFVNIKEFEVCSTPELSPHRLDTESDVFKFDNHSVSIVTKTDLNTRNSETIISSTTSTTTTTTTAVETTINNKSSNFIKTNHDIGIVSPNLSPIKENSPNLSLIEASINNNNNKSMTKKPTIDMDIDIGGILKAPIIKSINLDVSNDIKNVNEEKTSNVAVDANTNLTNNTINNSLFMDVNLNNKKYNREFSNEQNLNDIMNSSKPFTFTIDIETTTNQDQDTGYQTGGSTQLNMMDSTNYQDSINNFNSLLIHNKEIVLKEANDQKQNDCIQLMIQHQKTQQSINKNEPLITQQSQEETVSSQRKLAHSLTLNFDSIKSNNKRINSSYQQILLDKSKDSQLNIPFGGLYPLGSSTPEKSKPYFHLNDSYNDINDLLSVTNVLNTNTMYKHSSSINNTTTASITTTATNAANANRKKSNRHNKKNIVETNSNNCSYNDNYIINRNNISNIINEKADNKDIFRASAFEIDSSFMENSILKSKLSPSKLKLFFLFSIKKIDEFYYINILFAY